MTRLSAKDLREKYEEYTNRVIAFITFKTDYYGGQPATEAGLAAFVQHHLGLEGDEATEAIARIRNEELGEKDTTKELDEINEKEIYGVNQVRRDDEGPWVGNWQIKACMKVAASRLGVFVSKKGSKGDLAEMTRVTPFGPSKQTEHPDRVHFFNSNDVFDELPEGSEPSDSGAPVETTYVNVLGCISTPQGKKSISTHTETVPRGTRLCFEMRYPGTKLADEEIIKIFSAIGNIGLGSARAFENGTFETTIDMESAITPLKAKTAPKKKKDPAPAEVPATATAT